MKSEQVLDYFKTLQKLLIDEISKFDGRPFKVDTWERPEGGGGTTCQIENGCIIERGGVNFSYVKGDKLPASASASRPDLKDSKFEAMGVSVILHPTNPYIPTVHMNVRFFNSTNENGNAQWWFGGGMDLTPYYGFVDDAKHFHSVCKQSLDQFGVEYYPKFKEWCDKYFFIKHRNEPRGIGGLFFDDLSTPDFATCFSIIKSVGNHFLPAYLPIAEKRKNNKYGKRQRDFQAYRRGRYVEFNLVLDRGTIFGLQSNGRTESILMSMPPKASWRYDWQPDSQSEEWELYETFLKPNKWV